jgi:hypothetical protein
MVCFPCITVQSDWDQVIEDVSKLGSNESFWISIYFWEFNLEAIHGSVHVRRKYPTQPLALDGGKDFDIGNLSAEEHFLNVCSMPIGYFNKFILLLIKMLRRDDFY